MPRSKKDDPDPLSLADISQDRIEEVIAEKQEDKKAPSQFQVQKEERLAAKEARIAAKGTATEAPRVMVEEEPMIDKSVLLDKLEAYRTRFPNLKSRNKVSIKSSVDDLLDELHWFEVQLGSSGGGNKGCHLLIQLAAGGIETVTKDYWNPLNLNLEGLAQVTTQNIHELEPIVDELMIKYGLGLVIGPEIRLCLTAGALIMTVHAANSGNPVVASALQKVNERVVPPKGSTDL